MKTMLLAFACIAVIAVGAWYGLHQAGFSIQEVTTRSSVRLN